MDKPPPADIGCEALALLARYHGVAADAGQIRHRSGCSASALTVADLLRAGRELGLKTRSVSASFDELPGLPLSAIVKSTEGDYFILACVEGDKALIHDVRQGRPQTANLSELEVR